MPRNGADANISATDYARKCTAIIDLDRDLNALGAGSVLDFPRIAVIGGQSAGKSSLVEAVSGMNVPRDSGTCTRCPMECSMSSKATSWSCSISLNLRYDEDGKPLAAGHTNVPFAVITNRSEVELVIRRAQAAILCPHRATTEFSTMSANELKEALDSTKDSRVHKFSKNAVHIDVNDPELTDLSFIDLPGLIQNAKQDTISLVKHLVESNIKGENTLILITIPASDDMENQQAMTLAREVDPKGDRTIAVITKPDTVGEGSTGLLKGWKKALQGESPHKLRHGYYCVRLPNDAERAQRITRTESQRRANEFFDTKSPWKDIQDRKRLGIPHLVSDISSLLVNLIEKNLPMMKARVDELIIECIDNLKQLPSPPLNEPSTEMLLRISKFCDDLKNTATADQNKYVTQEHRRRYEKFQEDIRSTTPDFRPFEPSSSHSRPQENDIDYLTEPRDLGYVREVIRESIGWELPGHIPFEATKRLVLEYTSLWKDPAILCFEDIFDGMVTFIKGQLQKNFGDFIKLESYISRLIQPTLENFKAKCLKQLESVLTLETVPLFTLNTHYLKSAETKWTNRYTWAREFPYREYRDYGRVHHESRGWYTDSRGIRRFGTFTFRDVEEEAEDAKAPYSISNDEFRDEIKVMANARAYFQVAYKRFVDDVPLTIEHGLKQPLASEIRHVLFTAVLQNGNGSETLAALLEEDPSISEKRKIQEERKVMLLKIKRKLDNFTGLEEIFTPNESESSEEHSSEYHSDSASISPSPNNLDPQLDSELRLHSSGPSMSGQDSESRKGKSSWKRLFSSS